MKLTTIKIRQQDLKRIKKLSLVTSEPRWSVIQRALDKLEDVMKGD